MVLGTDTSSNTSPSQTLPLHDHNSAHVTVIVAVELDTPAIIAVELGTPAIITVKLGTPAIVAVKLGTPVINAVEPNMIDTVSSIARFFNYSPKQQLCLDKDNRHASN